MKRKRNPEEMLSPSYFNLRNYKLRVELTFLNMQEEEKYFISQVKK